MNVKLKSSERAWRLATIAALCALLPATASASSVLVQIGGSPEDYESRLQTFTDGTPPVTRTGAGADETLSVSSVMLFPGFAMQESRPIFQFDLSSLAGTDPAADILQSATLRLSLLSVSDSPQFTLEAWGRNENLPGPVSQDASNAGAQFASSAYARADAGGLDGIVETGVLEIDVTDFMRSRHEDWLGGGGDWVLFRLQPDDPPSIADEPDTSFVFASADHGMIDRRPVLSVSLIPEPGVALLAFAGLGMWAARRRLPLPE